ncbi:hypothetical protein EVAR_56237_1 [Eumeta japonica]|uniref:Uncharacterized protein n=1 Tax=Eumeta variegata TaxID=151549 RepID=A0A4C1XK85_EUMVA|nr:hypothetical protein EVAR_56237_1 [Eumeta japonica]
MTTYRITGKQNSPFVVELVGFVLTSPMTQNDLQNLMTPIAIQFPVTIGTALFHPVVITKVYLDSYPNLRLCAAAVSLLLGRIGQWSGKEIARSALSLAARLRRNATMSRAFSCVQPTFIDL